MSIRAGFMCVLGTAADATAPEQARLHRVVNAVALSRGNTG